MGTWKGPQSCNKGIQIQVKGLLLQKFLQVNYIQFIQECEEPGRTVWQHHTVGLPCGQQFHPSRNAHGNAEMMIHMCAIVVMCVLWENYNHQHRNCFSYGPVGLVVSMGIIP